MEESVIVLVAKGVVTDDIGELAAGEDHDNRADSKPVRDRDLEVVASAVLSALGSAAVNRTLPLWM